MLVIIGAIIGLFGSLLPEVLKFLNNKEDHKHEIDMAKVQIEMSKLAGEIKLAELNATADIEETKAIYAHATVPTGDGILTQILAFISHTVRPVITYAFMATYILVKYAVYISYTQVGYTWTQAISVLWGEEDFAVFATIMAFWFGGRFMKYSFNKFVK
jgi:hypothetical protein